MTAGTELIRPLDGADGIHMLRKGKHSAALIGLADGSFCLYSPLPNPTEALLGEIREIGAISILLAPNHYHHRGLAAHADAFPDARILCSAGAAARLKTQTGLAFDGLDFLQARLRVDTQVLIPQGLKTGEIWLKARFGTETVWIVCDGFTAPALPDGFADAPSILSTFPKYGIKDSGSYADWLGAQLDRNPPTILVPCHGSPVRNRDLGRSLRRLMEDLP